MPPEGAQTPDDPDFAGVDFECPHCGRIVEDYRGACPHCGGTLAEEFSGTYRPAPSVVVKAIAMVALVAGLALAAAAVVWYLAH